MVVFMKYIFILRCFLHEVFCFMFRNISILLIEDDEVEIEHIKRSFQKSFFNVALTCVNSALEALNFLRDPNNRNPLVSSFIILLDMNLPRMKGSEFLQILRQDSVLKISTVFVLTGSVNEHDIQAAYNAGVAGYILKDKVGEDCRALINLLKCYLLVSSPFNEYLFLEGNNLNA